MNPTPKELIRSLPALLPSPLGFCDLCRGAHARSILVGRGPIDGDELITEDEEYDLRDQSRH